MSDAPRPFSRATLFVLFSACCFGSISTFVTLAITSGARLVDVLAWRYAGAALLLAAASGGAAIRAPGRRAWAMVVLLGGGQAAIAFVSLSALRYIPVATLTFLFYTYPAWVAAIAAVRRTEPLTTRRTAALVLSLTGIAVMVGTPGSGGLHPIGVLLALSSALLYAVYIPLIDRLGRGIPPSVTSTYAAGGAGIVLIVVALAQGGLAVRFAPLGWFAVFMLAVVCTVLAFLAFLRGLSEIGPVRTAIISTVEPFWTALLGNVVLGQSLGPRTLAGGVLIAAAVIVLQLGHRASAAPIEASA
ncbi:MAG: DMT family transporter [Gemmatimonadaceae bacterium]|nr:DMT family transporter [Gemmatimonadaceae bacterium]NUR35885.1 DMT family transporter [Gemmatimonadaceae bacterium]NUS46433.1 DMT family transporter [Gemmatimonadaceae bacterium]